MGEGLAMTMLGEAFTPPSTSHLVWFAISRYQMEVVVEWDGWERSTSAANGTKSLLSHIPINLSGFAVGLSIHPSIEQLHFNLHSYIIYDFCSS